MDPYLSVIIPAYNEESRIGKTLKEIWGYLSKRSFSSEILVVLDGATDGTLSIVRKFSKGKEGRVRYIDRKVNRGKGFTVREGMLEAKGEIRLFTDADNSTDMMHFDKMQLFFESGHDVVIASRDPKDAKGATQAVPQGYLKRLFGNAGNLYIQFFAVRGIWDTQCGFKAFSANAARKIFSVSRIDRWGLDVETLALARKFGFRIGIIAAYWVNNAESHVNLSGYVSVLLETLKVRWWLMTKKYGR